jgi:universal stress protein A
MLPIHAILHPTDFSASSQSAFHLACALARDSGARLIVLHVRQLPLGAFGEFGAMPPPPEPGDSQEYQQLENVQPLDAAVSVERRLIDGDPATVISAVAQDEYCDMIVMGTHGRAGLSRLLMGSVAERVVRTAPCAVLTIKNPMPGLTAAVKATEQPVQV